MDFAVPPPALPSVAIANSDQRFPVRRIFCVGRNYADHAVEMGTAPRKGGPVFFNKPADCVVDDGATLGFPAHTENLHHEGELVVALASGGSGLGLSQARAAIWGYGCGNDLTRRDLQSIAKDMRRPWDMAKGFDQSAPCGPLVPVAQTGFLTTGELRCFVDGTLRQTGNLSDLIWPIDECISLLSDLVELCAGDLIYTGTPAGVGPIKPGQNCRVEFDGLPSVTTHYAA